MQYLTVKNFEIYQHYKQRGGIPVWIKLHRSLLTDYEFHALPDKSKAHLMLIWLLVSQRNDRRIPDDPRWVANRIGSTDKVDLQILVAGGWLIPAEILEKPASKLLEHFQNGASNPLDQNKNRKEEEEKNHRNDSPPSCADADSAEQWADAPWLLNFLNQQHTFNGNKLPRLKQYAYWSDLSEAINGVDESFLTAEFAKMANWLRDNPRRAPTDKGVRRFVASWLQKAADRRRQEKTSGNQNYQRR